MSKFRNIEILSLGYSERGCTKERWAEVFKDFEPRARYHASNLAAHNWDVLLIDGRVFLSSYYGDSGHWLSPDLAREDATEKQMRALYENPQGHPKKRLFADEQPA